MCEDEKEQALYRLCVARDVDGKPFWFHLVHD